MKKRCLFSCFLFLVVILFDIEVQAAYAWMLNRGVIPRVTIDPPGDVNSNNVHDFSLSGTCSLHRYQIRIYAEVAGRSVAFHPNTKCLNGRWQSRRGNFKGGRLRLTSFAKHAPGTITFRAEHYTMWNSREASVSVNYNFFCPVGFIPVPYRRDFYPFGENQSSFCLAKYEMTPHPHSRILSQSKGDSGIPFNVTKAEALHRCHLLGEQYDLMTNREWQLVARNVELQGSNWDSGKVGSGNLYIGHVLSWLDILGTSVSDSPGCLVDIERCHTDWGKEMRRTHYLSNGFVIWDLAGNIGEWVKDKIMTYPETIGWNRWDMEYFDVRAHELNDTDYPEVLEMWGEDGDKERMQLELFPVGGQIFMKKTTLSAKGTAKALLGPFGNYNVSLLSQDWKGGLGEIFFPMEAGVLSDMKRGGDYTRQGEVGLFSVMRSGEHPTQYLGGFRCAFHPQPPQPVAEKKIHHHPHSNYGRRWNRGTDW